MVPDAEMGEMGTTVERTVPDADDIGKKKLLDGPDTVTVTLG
jgi:hypothetical protein